MSDDVLILTKADANNYRALAAFVAGRHVRRTMNRRERDKVSWAKKLRMLQDQDYCCVDCGIEFHIRQGRCPEATVDHVIKYQYGGEANHHNSVVVCYPCNLKRDEQYSMEIIEDHYGPVDLSLVEYVPVVVFDMFPEKDKRHG